VFALIALNLNIMILNSVFVGQNVNLMKFLILTLLPAFVNLAFTILMVNVEAASLFQHIIKFLKHVNVFRVIPSIVETVFQLPDLQSHLDLFLLQKAHVDLIWF
jgi:hypothetical protein